MPNGWSGFDPDKKIKEKRKEKKREDPWAGPSPIYLIIIQS
jgi:hypothetical protein